MTSKPHPVWALCALACNPSDSSRNDAYRSCFTFQRLAGTVIAVLRHPATSVTGAIRFLAFSLAQPDWVFLGDGTRSVAKASLLAGLVLRRWLVRTGYFLGLWQYADRGHSDPPVGSDDHGILSGNSLATRPSGLVVSSFFQTGPWQPVARRAPAVAGV